MAGFTALLPKLVHTSTLSLIDCHRRACLGDNEENREGASTLVMLLEIDLVRLQ